MKLDSILKQLLTLLDQLCSIIIIVPVQSKCIYILHAAIYYYTIIIDINTGIAFRTSLMSF